MKIKFFVFIFFLSFSGWARPQANWPSLFGQPFKDYKITMVSTDETRAFQLTFLDSFPCYRDASWTRSDFRVDSLRQAYLKIYCVFKPDSLKFAYKDSKKIKPSLVTSRAQVEGVLNCPFPLGSTERQSMDSYQIDVKDCYVEDLSAAFPDAQ